jgi:Zn-finger nucleic acid-binding protein
MSMSCPRCQVLLCEVTSAGVVADACGTCRGMWLDRGELQEMVARVEGFRRAGSNGAQYAGTNAGLTAQTECRPTRTGEADCLRCPRCGDLLRATQRDGVRVDVCRRCRGVWLDDGEFERIKVHLGDLRRDWERDERDPGKAIRWSRPPRYPRHHPHRHLAPPMPPREPHRAGQFPRPFLYGGHDADRTSGAAKPPAGTRPDVSARRDKIDIPRHYSIFGKVWNACRPTIGTLLIILGFVLMFVPVLPGTPLLLIGMAVAGSSHPIVRFLRERWRRWRRRGVQDPTAVT